MRKERELEGKVALVTGGARNIGRAIARALAADGAAVMVNANTSREDAEQTVAMIRAEGGKAALHFADVTDTKAVGALVVATEKEFGRLDVLVNNAAIRAETAFAEMKLEEGAVENDREHTPPFLVCLRHLQLLRFGEEPSWQDGAANRRRGQHHQ